MTPQARPPSLDSIKKSEMQRTYARNPHELARVLEDETRITVSEMFLHACIIKIKTDESDLPGGTYVFNQLVGDEVVTTTKENTYWLKPPYAPTASPASTNPAASRRSGRCGSRWHPALPARSCPSSWESFRMSTC